MKNLIITGIRGIPAAHGGFETFAENLALFLKKGGWNVTVYCQSSTEKHSVVSTSLWRGVNLIHIPVSGTGAAATIKFDYLSVVDASKKQCLVLTLGYNTALFNLILRFRGIKNLINMDGIEWKRDKWRWYEKLWLYFNERLGCLIGNHLIADHPEIKEHLSTRVKSSKITMIPYGARSVDNSDSTFLKDFGLENLDYCIVIARPEPENSLLEIVRAFSMKKRCQKLVVLGKYDMEDKYHRSVLSAASDDVIFLGAIYDHASLDALRHRACLYIHGHTVGGTNPSLIEALGAAQPVLAHNNKFNRWVAGPSAKFFDDEHSCANQLDVILNSPVILKKMSIGSKKRFDSMFTWDQVLDGYEQLLSKWAC